MRTSEEYFEKPCRMRKNVYMDGKLLGMHASKVIDKITKN